MGPYHFIFLCVLCAGSAYLLMRRRVFDLPALAFFSCGFYFLPGVVGFAGYAQGLLVIPTPVEDTTYLIMTAVTSATLTAAMVSDVVGRQPLRVTPARASGLRWSVIVAVVIGVLAMMLTVVTVGGQLFAADKFGLLSSLNRWHLLWTSAATLGFVASVLARSRTGALMCAGLLILNLYVGFRVDLVIALIAGGSLWLMQQPAQRLADRWVLAIAVIGLSVLFFVLKYVLVAIQLQDFDMLVDQIRNPDAARYIFLYSEPFVAQGTLNEVVLQQFSADWRHLTEAVYILVPFANELGATSRGFNAIFQPALFSSVVDYGLGNNIWAQMYAVGRWALLGLFVVVYCIVLVAGDRVVRRLPAIAVPTAVVVMAYWAFYIHRNDLVYQLTLTRRCILVGGGIVAVAAALAYATCLLREVGQRSHRRGGVVSGAQSQR